MDILETAVAYLIASLEALAYRAYALGDDELSNRAVKVLGEVWQYWRAV